MAPPPVSAGDAGEPSLAAARGRRKSKNQQYLIVGGGIDSVGKAKQALDAGADTIVIGNAIEKNPNLLIE